MLRRTASLTLLFAGLSSSSAACTVKSGPENPALLGRCAPEVDMFAPSVTWAPPRGTRQKIRIVPFDQRPLFERDFEAEYLAKHHGIPPLELVLPEGREYEWLGPELSTEPEARRVVRIGRILRDNFRAQWTL